MNTLVTVGDMRGNVIARMVDLPLSDRDRAVADAVLSPIITEIAGETGLHPSQVAAGLLCAAMERERDVEAYQRVCEQRGLLPL